MKKKRAKRTVRSRSRTAPKRARSSGEETVGGTVATLDQSVVDEIARPLGVERPPDAPIITSDEMLSARDRRRWSIEQHTEERERDAEKP